MAVLGGTFLSLAEALKRTDPDNSIATIIELLSETNEIMEDAITLEGNLPTGHRTTVRTGIPSGTWRKLYQGVQPTRSTTEQVDDSAGMLEAYSEVDKALADLNGNTAQFRLSESQAFLEGLNQDMSNEFIYGDTGVNPERFMGLASRYDALSADKTKSGYNIVDGGGTGSDNTSAWFVTWDERVCHLIYPKGSMVGLSHEDKGQVTIARAADASMYEGYRDHFKWDIGLSLRDWRGVSRVANIDVSNVLANTVKLEELLIDGFYKVKKRPGKKVLYVNQEVMVGLHKRALAQVNTRLTIDEVAGKPMVSFLGVPVREVEAILNTEAQIT